MRFAALLLAPVALMGLVACTPAQTAGTTAPGASAAMPQSPNSLPPGDSVNAPITSGVGQVGTTRVR